MTHKEWQERVYGALPEGCKGLDYFVITDDEPDDDVPDAVIILPDSPPLDLPILDNMERGSYIDLSLVEPPGDCPNCPCRFLATRDGHHVVDACNDPARYRQLCEEPAT